MQSVLWIGFGVQETRTQKWKKGLFTPRGYGATKKNKTFLAFLHKFVQIIAKCVQISAKCVQISAKCVQISAKCVQICAKCVQICVKWMQKKYANPSKNSSQSCTSVSPGIIPRRRRHRECQSSAIQHVVQCITTQSSCTIYY